jgi:glutamate-1-semialdehyde 2,1-aminomutase
MFARGILILGSHNMSYAHQDSDIDLLLRAYDEVVSILVDAVASSSVREALACEPLVPLFKIR